MKKKKFYKKPPPKEDFYEAYLKTRKEYFAYFHSRHQKKKEEAYLLALKKYREFKPLVRKEYPLIEDYALKRQETSLPIPPQEQPIQRIYQFKEDQEISTGTMEDYHQYKKEKIS